MDSGVLPLDLQICDILRKFPDKNPLLFLYRHTLTNNVCKLSPNSGTKYHGQAFGLYPLHTPLVDRYLPIYQKPNLETKCMKKERKKSLSVTFATYGYQTPLLFYFLLIFFCSFSFAQEFELNNMPPPKMQLTFGEKPLNENGFAVLEITIPESWHVNSHIPVDEFLKPSQVHISGEGLTFGLPEWPTPKKDYNEILDLENLIFEGTFYIKIPISKTNDFYDSTQTKASFHYQACSKSICLAPDSVVVSTLSYFEHPFPNIVEKLETKKSSTQNVVVPEKKNVIHKENVNTSLDTEIIKNTDPEIKTSEKFDIKTSTPNVSAKEPPEKHSLILLLLFAFLGGLILNLMPCVLPVLSLKLFSLIKQSQESRKRLTLLSLTTCSGILISFWVLALFVFIARIAGTDPGWGMQFQSPAFIAAMIALLTLFAMSFFGLFEIWLPGQTVTKMDSFTKKEGFLGAFFTGALLVLLSTPCSAPFLGSAMGFAFNAPNAILFLFFTAAALGLATPYLLIGVFPSLLRILPKPGKWMLYLQKIMGILLLASVLWLLWIGFSAFGKMGFLFFSFIALLNLIFAFAIGKIAPPYKPFAREISAIAFVFVINFIIALLSPKFLEERSALIDNDWQAYSAKTLESMRLNGSIVFLDVTADWCITCKANEMAVIETQEINDLFAKENVKKIKADWTHSSTEVTQLLRSLKRSGVPAYAIYPADTSKTPIVLSEILTFKQIQSAIKNAQNFK